MEPDRNPYDEEFDPEHNPHDEELAAEVRNYLIWCYGRLEELRRAGLLQGPEPLTERGWADYQTLVASGFVPIKEKVVLTLQSCEDVPPELVDKLASLILGE